MWNKRNVLAAAIAVGAACLVYVALSYAALPAEVAVHFDAGGNPNGWSGKSAFLGWFVGGLVCANALFLAAPWLLRKTPPSLISLPYKAYWFSTPERKEEIFKKTDVILGSAVLYVNALSLLMYHSIHQENVGKSALYLSVNVTALIILGLGALFAVYALVCVLTAFQPPKDDAR